MASTSDGWPQFIKTFDEWRERKARESGGKGFPGGGMDARTGQGGDNNGLRSSARSGGRPMTTRFNPPPGWPPVPDGWTPPPEWQPDPTWPAPPAGWQLWVDETPTSPHRAIDSAWAIAGGTAVFLGSLLPFISFSDPEIAVNPGARAASALFGLIVLGLGIASRAVQHRFLMGTSLATLCLSVLGALGYAITIVAGLAGVTEQGPLGFSVKVTFSPGIGILLALAGCVAAAVAGIRSIQHYRS
jgi:hypothetical protein